MIIIAPHPDDELIGCYSSLNEGVPRVKEVWYVFDHQDPVRRKEAEESALKFRFDPRFIEGISGLEHNMGYLERTSYEVRVPSIHDAHPQHKQVNRMTRHLARSFYSVDLDYADHKRSLGDLDSIRKRSQLDTLYPSQASLWSNNASYYLFECVTTSDIHVLTCQMYRVDWCNPRITVWSDNCLPLPFCPTYIGIVLVCCIFPNSLLPNP